MGKPRRNVRPKKEKPNNDVYDESLSKADIPSSKELSSEYYNDAIDTYHEEKYQNLMKQGVSFDIDNEQYDSEEEVMPLDIADDDEDDDDEEEEGDEEEEDDDRISMGSDLEDRDKDGLPDEMAWGEKKKLYYDTDYKQQKKKVKKTKEELEAEAEEEEEEAQNIQRRLAKTLSEEDYGLDFLQEFAEKPNEEMPPVEQKIVKDLEKISDKEKRKLLKKESPELIQLIQDLKLKMAEVKNELEPLIQMMKDGIIPKGKGSAYLRTKYQLYLNYCSNVSYYLVLKAKRIPISGHPVIERLVTYRNLINDLAVVDERLSPQIRLLLSEEFQKKLSEGEVSIRQSKPSKKAAVKRPVSVAKPADDSDTDEEAALNYYKMMENRLLQKRKRAEEPTTEEAQDEEMDPDAKRGITYQMAKNKGLTPKRRKIDRNPRVKHREKFRRAQIRRKGQVRAVRTEEVRYSGEKSGIRAGVKRSTKLKF